LTLTGFPLDLVQAEGDQALYIKPLQKQSPVHFSDSQGTALAHQRSEASHANHDDGGCMDWALVTWGVLIGMVGLLWVMVVAVVQDQADPSGEDAGENDAERKAYERRAAA
jgi:hypothetical protein